MAEIAAVASDLPAGSPDLSLDGRTVIGEVSDSDTKACYFILKRLWVEGDSLRAEALNMRTSVLQTGNPREEEVRDLDIRFALHGMKSDAVRSLFWGGICSAVVEKLRDQPNGPYDLVLGIDWKVGVKNSEPDPFAGAFLRRLLSGGVHVIDVGDVRS